VEVFSFDGVGVIPRFEMMVSVHDILRKHDGRVRVGLGQRRVSGRGSDLCGARVGELEHLVVISRVGKVLPRERDTSAVSPHNEKPLFWLSGSEQLAFSMSARLTSGTASKHKRQNISSSKLSQQLRMAGDGYLRVHHLLVAERYIM